MYHTNEQKNTATSCKYLVLYIDGKMTFRDHIYYVVEKLTQFSGLAYKVRHLCPSKSLLLFPFSCAESVIRYGLLIYSSLPKPT